MGLSIVGIDPDVERSGIARIDLHDDGTFSVRLGTLAIADMVDALGILSRERDSGASVLVVIEAGWLCRPNWHKRRGMSPSVIARLGLDVGRNQQIGMDIRDIARHDGLEVIEARPLMKVWKGKDGKITHDELDRLVGGLPKRRTNQEERDSCLLAWAYKDSFRGRLIWGSSR